MNWTSNDIERFKDRIVKPGSKFSVIDDTLLKKVQGERKYEESDLQINCVETFRLMYPKLKWRLFSVPNEGIRDTRQAERLVRQGLSKGVLDIFICIKNKTYSGIFIDFKTDKGRLSEYQVNFIKAVQQDYYCCVVRSVEEFLREVGEYLNSK